MRSFRRPLLLALMIAAAFVLVGRGSASPPLQRETAHRAFRVLLFTRTTGFRHDSIPAGVTAVTELGRSHHFTVDATEDPGVFAAETLGRYAVVIFLNTTGDILDNAQQEALKRFVERGGGFVGVHAATDTEPDWPWYGTMLGARFKTHPAIQNATLHVVDRNHASTAHLPATWERRDEWYDYHAPPPKDARILIMLDESTYEGGTMGADHPIAWSRTQKRGRVWHTGLGHTIEGFDEPLFRKHLAGGILWAAGNDTAPPGRERSKSPSR